MITFEPPVPGTITQGYHPGHEAYDWPVLEDNQSEQSMMDMEPTTGVLEWVGSLSTDLGRSIYAHLQEHTCVITTKVMSWDCGSSGAWVGPRPL